MSARARLSSPQSERGGGAPRSHSTDRLQDRAIYAFFVCLKKQSTRRKNKLPSLPVFPPPRRKGEGILRFALRRELAYFARKGENKPRVRRGTLEPSPL